MKTVEQVKAENPVYSKLIQAVITRIGEDSISDVNKHGIDGGFSGFIYYSETTKFYRCFRESIIALIEDMASDLGEDPLLMVRNFNCLKDYSDLTSLSIASAMLGGNRNADEDEVALIQNALAWFAAEEVCRMFED